MSLTYLQFHALFIVPPLVGLWVALQRRRRRASFVPRKGRVFAVALLSVVAVLYTTPWDNYLIERGVWWYGDGRVFATLWHAPVEEYLFMALQPVVAALWLYLLPTETVPLPRVTTRARAFGVAAGLAVAVAGFVLLGGQATYYLGAILLWGGPVLAIQWGFAWPVLWALRRTVALGVLAPSAYLWVVDWVAIDAGVWTISGTYTTGVTLLGLPIEEAVFFLVTNLFVVQGLVLFDWVVDRWW